MTANLTVQRFDQWTKDWHAHSPDVPAEELLAMLHALHLANFELWHQEDEARRPTATEAQIAATKRAIDRYNQQRNDTVEKLDTYLLERTEQKAASPMHSETPGMIVDRLSILSLKRFHTQEQAERKDADEGHRERNRARLAVLQEQSDDLQQCLDTLWAEVLAGTRRFKLYRQMKMYNDPELNPAIYTAGRK